MNICLFFDYTFASETNTEVMESYVQQSEHTRRTFLVNTLAATLYQCPFQKRISDCEFCKAVKKNHLTINDYYDYMNSISFEKLESLYVQHIECMKKRSNKKTWFIYRTLDTFFSRLPWSINF